LPLNQNSRFFETVRDASTASTIIQCVFLFVCYQGVHKHTFSHFSLRYLAYAICAVLCLLELGLLKLIQTTSRFQKLTAWMSDYQNKYRQSTISSAIELSDIRDPKNDLGVLHLKTQACNQTQTRNRKFARADGITNLMQLPDAAPLVTAGFARAGKSNLEMDLFSSAIRNVSAIQAVIESSADPRMDGVKPVDQRSALFAVSERVISSPSVLNPIVSSPLARAAVTHSISVRRQHAAELVSRNSDNVSQAPFAAFVFEDIPAAPRSRSKSRALKQTVASMLPTAVVSSSTLPTLPPKPRSRSQFQSRDDLLQSSHASVTSSAAISPASTAPSAPPFLPAHGVISSATSASPSPFASPALQNQRNQARARRQAVADALAGVTRTSGTNARFGDC
jgi:hypothetical protein